MNSTITRVKLVLTYGDTINTRTVCEHINISKLKIGENKIRITNRKIIRLLRRSSLYEVINSLCFGNNLNLT